LGTPLPVFIEQRRLRWRSFRSNFETRRHSFPSLQLYF
jgi:hypothetical protein